MENFLLDITRRDETTRSSTKSLRGEGKIPAVVYHRGDKSIPAVVAYNEFVHLAQNARISQVFTFKSSDSAFNGRAALVRDIQKDYVTGKVIHIDFQALKDDEVIRLTVPLHFMGDAVGVKVEGGVLSVHSHQVNVACLPKDIPPFIEYDVSEMKLNTHIHARDLPLPKGVKLAGSGDEPIVSVVIMKEEEIAPTATAAPVEGAAAPEGGAPAAAGGAAPAAGAAAPEGGKAKK